MAGAHSGLGLLPDRLWVPLPSGPSRRVFHIPLVISGIALQFNLIRYKSGPVMSETVSASVSQAAVTFSRSIWEIYVAPDKSFEFKVKIWCIILMHCYWSMDQGDHVYVVFFYINHLFCLPGYNVCNHCICMNGLVYDLDMSSCCVIKGRIFFP